MFGSMCTSTKGLVISVVQAGMPVQIQRTVKGNPGGRIPPGVQVAMGGMEKSRGKMGEFP